MIARRVQRGFRRLGLLVAVPLLVVAAVILTVAGVQAITAPHETEYPTFPDISGCDHLLATAARDHVRRPCTGMTSKNATVSGLLGAKVSSRGRR
jgi:hypothetical protein